MNEPSIFTKIISREIPAKIRYEDELFIAFDDIHPKAPVHVLLVPKKEYPTLEAFDADDTELHGKLLQTARKVAHTLGIEKNYKLMMNVGLDVQIVHHVHLHILGGWKKQKDHEEPIAL
jgi:histidine triad (HIT) family protein